MISRELTAASTEPIVLSILSSGGETYGYELIQKVRLCSDGELKWTEGMLYPVLHRLQTRGLIRSRWGKGDSGPRRRYYRLTAKGKKVLAQQQAQWRTVNSTLEDLWETRSHA